MAHDGLPTVSTSSPTSQQARRCQRPCGSASALRIFNKQVDQGQEAVTRQPTDEEFKKFKLFIDYAIRANVQLFWIKDCRGSSRPGS